MKLPPAILTAALLLTALSACSRAEPERTPGDDANLTTLDEPTPAATPDRPSPLIRDANLAEEVPAAANASADVPLDPPVAPTADQQVLDDAAATGMTARATRDDPPANDTEPAQPEAK